MASNYQKYYLITTYRGKDRWVAVKGRCVTIKGWEGQEMFVHHVLIDARPGHKLVWSKHWIVSEGLTGRNVGVVAKTQAQAIVSAQDTANQFNLDSLVKQIDFRLTQQRISPRYRNKKEQVK